MDMEAVIRQLQDTATVMAGIQARQAEVQKGQAEWLDSHEKRMAEHDKQMAESRKRFEQIEQNLLEATEKLNAIIVIVDDLERRRKNGGPSDAPR
jgi:hypothetical protein